MRISDWSSDVCSSDLPLFRRGGDLRQLRQGGKGLLGRTQVVERELDLRHREARARVCWIRKQHTLDQELSVVVAPLGDRLLSDRDHLRRHRGRLDLHLPHCGGHRKSVVSGKSVSVRVDIGGGLDYKTNRK